MEKNRYNGERNVTFNMVEELLYRNLNSILTKYSSMDIKSDGKEAKNGGEKITHSDGSA